MSSSGDLVLASPPLEPRARELWLQHAAGKILFQGMREHARERIDPKLDEPARVAAYKGIDDAIYGLMMILDGVQGGLRGNGFAVGLETKVQLWRAANVIAETSHVDEHGNEITERHLEVDEKPLLEIDLQHGDGMCMGYHFWKEGDFGADPVVVEA